MTPRGRITADTRDELVRVADKLLRPTSPVWTRALEDVPGLRLWFDSWIAPGLEALERDVKGRRTG